MPQASAVRPLLVSTLLLLGSGTPLLAQTHATIRLRRSEVAAGTSDACTTEIRRAGSVTAPSAADTVIALVVADDASTTAAQSPARLLVHLNSDTLGDIAVNDTGETFALTRDSLRGRTLTVSREDSHVLLCSIGIRPTPGRVITDPIVRELVARDSARLDSLRNRQRLQGNGFIILSLIKSISGSIPDAEFFDLRMKFGPGIPAENPDPRKPEPKRTLWTAVRDLAVGPSFTFASVDVSLSTQADTSAADSSRRWLTDATLSRNITIGRKPGSRDDRIGYVALPYFKVFNTKSYLGFGYGGLELKESRLEGTMVQASYLFQLYPDSVKVDSTGSRSYPIVRKRHNIFLDFYVRVPGAQFLDRLRVRGGILFPIGRGLKPETRIVLSVPIVDLDRF